MNNDVNIELVLQKLTNVISRLTLENAVLSARLEQILADSDSGKESRSEHEHDFS